MLGHFKMPHTIQLREHSMGGGLEGAPYAFRNSDGNRYVSYAHENGKQFVENWNWLENDMNDNVSWGGCISPIIGYSERRHGGE